MLSLVPDGEYRAFVESGGRILRPRIERSIQCSQMAGGLRVLDVGSGRGEVVARATQLGATAVGIDYSADCVKLAGETLAELGMENRLAVADATAMPFPDSTFDRIFFLDVIEHLPEHVALLAMKEMRRVLRPNGFIIIHTLPNRWALTIGYSLLRLLFRSLPQESRSDTERHIHINEQDIVSLRKLAERADLACHIWLDGTISKQAGWEAHTSHGSVARRNAYSILRRPAFSKLYGLAVETPLRLLLANDIYCIAWKKGATLPGRRERPVPSALSEKVVTRLLFK